jgi:hypothetical protein
MNKIIRSAYPEALALIRAWEDEVIVTGQTLVARPYWYENTETGQLYYDLYGCVGWPTEVSDKDDGTPGYAAIVGVVKPKTESRQTKDAVFQLLVELENKDVPTLLDGIQTMRKDYGFDLGNLLLQTFWGDPDRYITTLALLNERLMINRGSINAILISPPDDFYVPKSFDHYVRSLRSVLMPDKVRMYFGKNEILRTRLKDFKRDDPAVTAVGGLVHSLLSQTMWMDQVRENAFIINGEEDLGYE